MQTQFTFFWQAQDGEINVGTPSLTNLFINSIFVVPNFSKTTDVVVGHKELAELTFTENILGAQIICDAKDQN